MLYPTKDTDLLLLNFIPQAEEDAASAQLGVLQLSNPGPSETAFSSHCGDAIRKVHSYEDELAQAVALSVMELERMSTRAEEAAALSSMLGEDPPLAMEDALAMELLSWFKLEFFAWVDQPPCAFCNSTTRLVQMVQPSPTEAAHLAGRVELYRCTRCQSYTRFPRYNDPVKLLETRRGRCGEWANAFALCCRAAGLDTRLAVDWEDHIWVEYYSFSLQRWIHMDPCEASYDKPLLYEQGWGKNLSYVIAVGRTGVADVTQRYTRKYDEVLRRRNCSETWVRAYLSQTTSVLRSSLPAKEREELGKRDAADAASMVAAASKPLTEEDTALPGRQTGSQEWVSSRGEGGNTETVASCRHSNHKAAQKATRWRWARDGEVALRDKGRVCGGIVRASGENAPAEVAECAFDGSNKTKWLDFGGCGYDTAWLEYRVSPLGKPVTVVRYALCSANDAPERDPTHVIVEAWAEGKDAWVVLDERTDLHFPGRGSRVLFEIEASKVFSSSRFRLRIVEVLRPLEANSVQLARWDLYSQLEERPSDSSTILNE